MEFLDVSLSCILVFVGLAVIIGLSCYAIYESERQSKVIQNFKEKYEWQILKCNNCGCEFKIDEDIKYCPKCGVSIYETGLVLRKSGKYCSYCVKYWDDKADYCYMCGNSLKEIKKEYVKVSNAIDGWLFEKIYIEEE